VLKSCGVKKYLQSKYIVILLKLTTRWGRRVLVEGKKEKDEGM